MYIAEIYRPRAIFLLLIVHACLRSILYIESQKKNYTVFYDFVINKIWLSSIVNEI